MTAYDSELSRLVDQLNRATAGKKSGEKTAIDQILALAVDRNASDVILVAESPVAMRIKGSLTTSHGRVAVSPLLSEEIRSMLLPLLTVARS